MGLGIDDVEFIDFGFSEDSGYSEQLKHADYSCESRSTRLKTVSTCLAAFGYL